MKHLTVSIIGCISLSLIFALNSEGKLDKKNIMGMWLFDEGKGKVATDSSGNGNDGEIHDAEWVDGKFGKALSFDGVGNWVEVPHSPTVGFAAGTSFSISLHYKGTKVGGALVGKNYEDKSQALPWYLLWDDGSKNTVTMFLRDNASTSYRADSKSTIADDKWHFIVGVADASSGMASIWIDGKQEAEIAFNAKDEYGTTEGVLHIARHFDRYTDGIIDDVGLFDVALEEDDIKTLMDAGLEEAASVDAVDKLATTWGDMKRKHSSD